MTASPIVGKGSERIPEALFTFGTIRVIDIMNHLTIVLRPALGSAVSRALAIAICPFRALSFLVLFGSSEGLNRERISKVKVLPEYRLELEFEDGVSGIVDLSEAVGKGVFALWRDPLVFEQVRIGSSGELVWGEQVDLCPDALYLKVTGKNLKTFFRPTQPSVDA